MQLAKLKAQSSRDSETKSTLTLELAEFKEFNTSSGRELERLRARVCVRSHLRGEGGDSAVNCRVMVFPVMKLSLCEQYATVDKHSIVGHLDLKAPVTAVMLGVVTLGLYCELHEANALCVCCKG